MTTHNLFELMADVTGQHDAGILPTLRPPKLYWPHAAPKHADWLRVDGPSLSSGLRVVE